MTSKRSRLIAEVYDSLRAATLRRRWRLAADEAGVAAQ
jgi:hypothetical protein